MGPAIAHTMSSTQCPICGKPLEKKKPHRNCELTIKVTYADSQQVTLHRDPNTKLFHCFCDKRSEDHSFGTRQGVKYHIQTTGANWKVCAMDLAMTHS
jgi:hypothetical protein